MKEYALFFNFQDGFVKFFENDLDYEVGQFTKVRSSKGKVKDVMCYATLTLPEEFEREALKIMHAGYDELKKLKLRKYNLRVTLFVINTICEGIQELSENSINL